MTSLADKNPLNRQEFSYYFLLASLSLFVVFATALSLLYALPRPNVTMARVSIGESAQFPSTDRPYLVTAEETSLFIVRTETGWLALDHQTPYEMSSGSCQYVWEDANGRFVDPCSGSKFTLDGRLLEGPATQNLDQYPISEQSGELFVDLTTTIPGESSE